MLAYRMRHRIQFQRRVQTQDPNTGEIIVSWETVLFSGRLDVPAEVLTGPGRELIAADAQQAETTARINCRWFPVDRLELYTWRILWDGRIFNITSAETDRTARQEWRLRCSDGLTDGQ
ncbi:phage head closure protein [Azotobacter vinelandii]|uniref:phage head closure protein n=1 Tax=Azotobacter vinelandii TaxID=354 RepID=UPI0009170B73|nr:phage head closure protein [Azotobacter vinelandii]SFY16343.1 phage head-tail adaptor, putative, SPP1 family [Azotobacter vinelandii]